MNLRLIHRRLTIAMALAGLVAFAVGAGLEPVSAALGAAALLLAFFWQPSPELSARLERAWMPLAALLVLRALAHVFIIRDDVVIPVVDLLLLLMAAEALRSLDAPNDVRLYALSFALLLASTAYRPGIVFLLAFVAFVVLSTLALMIGHLRRQAERHGVRRVPVGRNLVGATALLSVVVLASSGFVFLTFPRVSRGWAGRGETLATSIAGFSDQVSIGEHGSRIYANPQIVLRVEFPDGRPADLPALHWRGRSYDRFDGVRWSRSATLPPSSGPGSWYRERWTGGLLRQRIYGAPLDVRVLFALHPVVAVEAENGIQPLFDNAGDYVYWGSGAPAYTAWSRGAPPPPDSLRSAERGFRPSPRHYLQLPDLDPRVRALADSLTAGLTTRYDKARAVERFLSSFSYTLELPRTAAQTSLEYFLFQRRAGHCEYFSTAMVVLLRAAGVEARNVNGFLGGEWSQFGDYLVVTQNQAHSWVEVWFPGYGWVPFDPTPGGAGAGTTERAWFWPGRIFFDGLQHRWNKWVLDYSVESQAGIFQRWTDWTRRISPEARRGAGGGGLPRLPVFLLLGGAAAAAWFLLRTRSGRVPPPAAAYLRLRRRCLRAGLPVPRGLTPIALVRTVEAERPEAAPPVRAVVDTYVSWRWGHQPLSPADAEELRANVRRAERALAGPPAGTPAS